MIKNEPSLLAHVYSESELKLFSDLFILLVFEF